MDSLRRFVAVTYGEYVMRLLGSVFLFGLTLLASIADLNGTWVGTFNGQPQKLLSDGSYPETVRRFELILKIEGTRITGTFLYLGEATTAAQPIRNGGRFGDRICFDILDGGDDHRWCVVANRDDLEGAWNLGPQGGPATGGLGPGVRIFNLRAKRLARSNGTRR
jgi:hypothetical protein